MLAESEVEHLDTIISRTKPIPKGKHLYSAGDPFSHVYAIRSGCLKSFHNSENGEEQITGFHLPGEIVGLEAISTRVHSNFTQALIPSDICAIPYAELDSLSATIPSLRQQLVNVMSKEISENYQLMLMLNQKTAEQKLASFLINLSARNAHRGGFEKEFNLLMTRSDLANYLGLAIETASRILSRFAKNDVIDITRRSVKIKSMAALSQIAGTQCHI